MMKFDKAKDSVLVPIGPVTRARAKRFKEALNTLAQHIVIEEGKSTCIRLIKRFSTTVFGVYNNTKVLVCGLTLGRGHLYQAIISHNSITDGAIDPKLLMEAMMGEMKRVMRLELEQIHEQIDRMENTHVEQPQPAPNV
ncbi:hypothetical protein TIFTF001_021113 [Ficus carica]|uniref:Uncharacterized protein n=1 Tax=Ficus carica TaxID=3494 RepID=A0AA88DBL1_FICCA|nr:hypothetical protein TIFTF001_021113 [Ficus carica]